MTVAIVSTCEHGGNRVPPELRDRFRGAAGALASHRGWDPGALLIARRLSRAMGCPLIATTISRLVVDPNRSRHHRELFSPWTRDLPPAEREALVERYWVPHRQAVDAALDRAVERHGAVLHLGVHSFVPRLRGHTRPFEIGLLYDPKRPAEKRWARALRAHLGDLEPQWRVRMNQPYRGDADGLTTAQRRQRPEPVYAGLELEVNQRLSKTPAGRDRVVAAMRSALLPLLTRAAL